jgi:molecular chaperone HtpG
MFSGGEERKFNNIKLYARRVFIQENAQTMMPEYLSFVHGLVDSDDLPLTISRENLQQTRILQVIRKNLVKKVVEAIEALAQDDDAEKYKKFYSHFSRNLKLGVHDDSKNRERLTNLLRFRSSKDEENESRSLADYVADMDSALTLPGEDPGGERELVKTFKPACDKVKEILGDYVDKVVISQRMENSPCCLVSGKYGYSANMERILKAQALRDPTNSSMVPAKKIMELNPQHVLVRQLRDAAPKDDNAHKTICSDLSWVLYETALLTSGFSLDNPSAFADRVHRLVAHGLGLLETPPGVPLPPSLRDTMNNDSGANTDGAPNAATEDTSGEMEQVD